MSTDVTNGATEELFTITPDGYDPENPTRAVEFTSTTLEVLTVDTAGMIATHVSYDRDTGDELARFEVPGIAESIEAGFVLRDLAAPPT